MKKIYISMFVFCTSSILGYDLSYYNYNASNPALLEKNEYGYVLDLSHKELTSLAGISRIMVVDQESWEVKPIDMISNLILNVDNNLLQELPEELTKISLIGLSGKNNSIKRFPNLPASIQVLNLENNVLRFLPQTISDLQKLLYLNLSGNQLTFLPNEIGALSNLEELHLSKNNLQQVPQIANLTARAISLDGNKKLDIASIIS